MEPVAIVSAIEPEMTLLRSVLENSTEDQYGFVSGGLDGVAVVLARSGIGKVNAAVTTALLIDHYRPRYLLFSGVAGGLDPDLNVGDVVVGTVSIQHDAGVFERGRVSTHQAGHIPFFNPADRLGFRPSPDLLARTIDALAHIELAPLDANPHPRIIPGVILTGDQFLSDPAERVRLHRQFEAQAIEMEGAAVAQVAERFGVDHLLIRALSDLAGEESDGDFARFLGQVAANAAGVIRVLVGVV